MDRQRVMKEVKEIKEVVEEIYKELNSNSPRKQFVELRIQHLLPQVQDLVDLIGG